LTDLNKKPRTLSKSGILINSICWISISCLWLIYIHSFPQRMISYWTNASSFIHAVDLVLIWISFMRTKIQRCIWMYSILRKRKKNPESCTIVSSIIFLSFQSTNPRWDENQFSSSIFLKCFLNYEIQTLHVPCFPFYALVKIKINHAF